MQKGANDISPTITQTILGRNLIKRKVLLYFLYGFCMPACLCGGAGLGEIDIC